MVASSITYSAVPASQASATVSTPPIHRCPSSTLAVIGRTDRRSSVVRPSGAAGGGGLEGLAMADLPPRKRVLLYRRRIHEPETGREARLSLHPLRRAHPEQTERGSEYDTRGICER